MSSLDRVATGDPLRGIALVGVITVHAATGAVWITGNLAGAGGTVDPDEAFTPVGEWILHALPTSVYLFFALSGFLIGRPFVEAFIQGRRAPGLARYVRNRFLRIFPAAWVVLVFVCLRYGTRDASFGEMASAFTLTESYTPHPLQSLIGQLWSLKVELGFYALVPAFFLAMSRLGRRGTPETRRLAVYGLALAGCGVSIAAALLMPHTAASARSLPYLLMAFMSGVALAARLAGRDSRRYGRRGRLAAGAGFAAGFACTLAAGQFGGDPRWLVNLFATLGVSGILWSAVMLEAGGHTWRWLVNPVVSWLGARSYAIYLWHLVVMSEVYPLLRGMEGYRMAMLALLPLTLVGSALVAELSWRLVERPALRLKARRRRTESAEPVAPLAPEAVPAG